MKRFDRRARRRVHGGLTFGEGHNRGICAGKWLEEPTEFFGWHPGQLVLLQAQFDRNGLPWLTLPPIFGVDPRCSSTPPRRRYTAGRQVFASSSRPSPIFSISTLHHLLPCTIGIHSNLYVYSTTLTAPLTACCGGTDAPGQKGASAEHLRSTSTRPTSPHGLGALHLGVS